MTIEYKFAQVENGVVKRISVANSPDWSADGWIACGDDVSPDDLYDGSVFSKPPKPPKTKEETNAEIWQQIRAKEIKELMPRTLRDFLLEQPGASQKPWYTKVNILHTEIEALKATLLP